MTSHQIKGFSVKVLRTFFVNVLKTDFEWELPLQFSIHSSNQKTPSKQQQGPDQGKACLKNFTTKYVYTRGWIMSYHTSSVKEMATKKWTYGRRSDCSIKIQNWYVGQTELLWIYLRFDTLSMSSNREQLRYFKRCYLIGLTFANDWTDVYVGSTSRYLISELFDKLPNWIETELSNHRLRTVFFGVWELGWLNSPKRSRTTEANVIWLAYVFSIVDLLIRLFNLHPAGINDPSLLRSLSLPLSKTNGYIMRRLRLLWYMSLYCLL